MRIDEIEIGHHFLTIWGYPLQELKEMAKVVYTQLPECIQCINPPTLWHHQPSMYHPYGTGPDIGRKHFKHFHILFPNLPSTKDVNMVRDIIKPYANGPIAITRLEDKVDSRVDEAEVLKLSLAHSNKRLRDFNVK